jgi:hypothetical protein
VVLEAGDDVRVEVDARKVDRRAQHLQVTGMCRRVVERQAHEVSVQAGGEAHGVLVPVQDVKSGRLLAEQVVVDHVVPTMSLGRSHANTPARACPSR